MNTSSAATGDSATLAELRRLIADRARIEKEKEAQLSAITDQIEALLGLASAKKQRKPRNKTFSSSSQFVAACQPRGTS